MKGTVLGYPGHPVLKAVDFDLRQGDFYPLVGVNGSGKSTFLKTVVGILKPLGGMVELTENGGRHPPIGYIPQAEKLDPIFPLSVFDVVLMGTYGVLRPGRRMQDEYRNLARECLEQAEAQDLGKRLFSELSSGQKQRVLLARALAARPQLLVLDEPTAGIDLQGERVFARLIARINRTRGIAVLLATHNRTIVRNLASRVLWLHEGRVEAVEPNVAFRDEETESGTTGERNPEQERDAG